MKRIDHMAAEFDVNSLTRGYYCNSGGSTVFYGKDIGNRKIHVIMSTKDGWFEDVLFNQHRTVEHKIDGMAIDEEEAEFGGGFGWVGANKLPFCCI